MGRKNAGSNTADRWCRGDAVPRAGDRAKTFLSEHVGETGDWVFWDRPIQAGFLAGVFVIAASLLLEPEPRFYVRVRATAGIVPIETIFGNIRVGFVDFRNCLTC